MPETLPARPLRDGVIDRVAREIAAQVAQHLETMYPDAARAVAWKSAKRSVQGVVRNAMSDAGRAAEAGTIEQWLSAQSVRQLRERKGWKAAGVGYHACPE